MKKENSNCVWPYGRTENELQSLTNALTNLNLNGYKVHLGRGRKAEYFLTDNEGNSITGIWDYTRINHFIMGYGKAYNKFKSILAKV